MPITPSPILVTLAVGLLAGSAHAAQEPAQPSRPAAQPPAPAPARAGSPLGLDAFGGIAITWPIAKDSFEAVSLDTNAIEYGGGARVTNLWRDLFAQVSFSRWSDTGERAFVDSSGESFPLGIPLDVEATFVDVTAGWKSVMRTARGSVAALPYVGAGVGIAMYSESSPFSEAGEDVDESKVSYHGLAGVEIPILPWLAAVVEGRYRYVPDILGEGGVSAALGEDALGGFQIGFAMRVGFGGSIPPRRPIPPPAPPGQTRPPVKPPAGLQVESGVILSEAPVYLFPDTTRTPLRTLVPGTAVRILEETKEWFRIQFTDPQFGPRVGYVLRKFVQIGKS